MTKKTKRKLKLFGFMLLWLTAIILVGCSDFVRPVVGVLLPGMILALATSQWWVKPAYCCWLRWFFKHGCLERAQITHMGRKTLFGGRILTVVWHEDDRELREEQREAPASLEKHYQYKEGDAVLIWATPDLFNQWRLVDEVFIDAEAMGVPLPPELQMEWQQPHPNGQYRLRAYGRMPWDP